MIINKDKLEQATGLVYDKDTKLAHGQINGYSVAVTDGIELNQNVWHIVFSVHDTSGIDWKEVKKGNKRLYSIDASEHKVHVVGKMSFKAYEALAEVCNYMTQVFAQHGLRSVCSMCGRDTEVHAVGEKGYAPNLFCNACADEYAHQVKAAKAAYAALPEDVPKGILGAFLGSLIGAAAIVLLGLLGYVAVVAGIIMGAATIWFYNKFAGKLSVKGIVISVLIALAMVFVANTLLWGLAIDSEYHIGVFNAISIMPDVMAEDSVFAGDVIKDYALQYLFCLVGIVIMVVSNVKDLKHMSA